MTAVCWTIKAETTLKTSSTDRHHDKAAVPFSRGKCDRLQRIWQLFLAALVVVTVRENAINQHRLASSSGIQLGI